MRNEGRGIRLDPAQLSDPFQYIRTAQKDSEYVARLQTSLASVFTPISEAAYTRLVLDRPDGLLIPEKLSGYEPAIREGEITLNVNTLFPIGSYDDDLRYAVETVFSGGHYLSSEHPGIFKIVLPVGKFGADSTLALVQTVRALYTVLPQTIKDVTSDADNKFRSFLQLATFQKKSMLTILDSVNSMAQAFSFLTNASDTPGYEAEPVGLFRVFIENGTFSRLARMLDLADLGTVNAAEASPVNIIDPQTLTIKSDFAKKMFARLRERRERRGFHLDNTGHGCPVASHNSLAVSENKEPRIIYDTGVDLLAKVFVEYYEHFYKNGPKTKEAI